jgi:hypothetical protein
MEKQISQFSMTRGRTEQGPNAAGEGSGPDLDDPKVARAMAELERDMSHLDENNPRHMAVMMRKMKELMPPGSTPKEFDAAIKRLEAGEDPEKIEAEMGDVFDNVMGDCAESSPGGGSYTRDSGLYDY